MALTRISACRLFDSFMNGTSSSLSGMDSRVAATAAPAGGAPRVVAPSTRTPCGPSAARNSAAAYPVGSHTAIHSDVAAPPAGTDPVTVNTFEPCVRSTEIVFGEPAAPVTAVFAIVT